MSPRNRQISVSYQMTQSKTGSLNWKIFREMNNVDGSVTDLFNDLIPDQCNDGELEPTLMP